VLLASKLPVPDSFRQEYLEHYGILPLEFVGDRLRVAVVGEPDGEALADLERSYDAHLDLIQVTPEELAAAIRQTFAASESVVEMVRDIDDQIGPSAGLEERATDIRDLANQPPVIRFVNLLIREAFESGASDVHLEAVRDGIRVRLRLDGVLTELPSPPRAWQAAVVSRLKLLAELDISERRLPQDGRIRVRLEARELDLRVATVPTLYGESVVLRLLDRGGQPVTLPELGMPVQILADVEALARRPHGILLVTGPTGSGKTTTLYAALGLRQPTEEKIITVEDPVEYHLPLVTQVPVRAQAGFGFAGALRSLLRQDPDVLMIGEMRDSETASIAIQAALTGHVVFATLHTNDALSALPRLLDLGVEPYLVASTLNGVLAQRLVRRVCPDCRTRYRPEPAVAALLAGRPIGGIELVRGAGCARCRQTGYRGRIGLFELLLMDDEIREAVARRDDIGRLRELARTRELATLRHDGWAKVQAGVTTIEEVLRVVGD
jgi:general secretion pathway protein E